MANKHSNKIFINEVRYDPADFKIDFPKATEKAVTKTRVARTRTRMTIASQLSGLTYDTIKQALEVAYQSAMNNYNRALEFKQQQGVNWTVEEEEILLSFQSHVNVVIQAANEIGMALDKQDS